MGVYEYRAYCLPEGHRTEKNVGICSLEVLEEPMA